MEGASEYERAPHKRAASARTRKLEDVLNDEALAPSTRGRFTARLARTRGTRILEIQRPSVIGLVRWATCTGKVWGGKKNIVHPNPLPYPPPKMKK